MKMYAIHIHNNSGCYPYPCSERIDVIYILKNQICLIFKVFTQSAIQYINPSFKIKLKEY